MISKKDSGSAPTQSNNCQKPQTYKVIKLIGEGTFGKAYLVECNLDQSLCVIKTINIDSMTDEERKETLMEAKILEKLDHPNIIKFKEVFMARKPRFTLNIVTDFADGGDLQGKIKQQKTKNFTESQILDWFTQICLAIKHLHDKKILHRDLKSQNIFLTESGMVKLGDFGIAKCLECTWEKAMTVVGTPYYLSPEIVQNKPYSFKSDIWSLGVLLYEMMALKMPFDATSLPMLSLKIMKGNYNPPPHIYTKDLRLLVSMLLSVDPNKRPPINDILKMPIIKTRIQSFLNEVEYNKEFSKTIVKKFGGLNEDKGKELKKEKEKEKDDGKKFHSPFSVNSNANANANANSNPTSNNVIQSVNANVGKNSNPGPVSNSKATEISQNPNISVAPNKNAKKKLSDQKEVAQFFKNNDEKKKVVVTPISKEGHKLSAVEKVDKSEPQDKNAAVVLVSAIPSSLQIQSSNSNSSTDDKPAPMPLKDFLKKKREEMKNQNSSHEACIWIEKKDIPIQKLSEEKAKKFPKIIIVEKPQQKKSSGCVDIIEEVSIPQTKKKKADEEFYNVNRCLNEMAKIANEDEEEEDSNEGSEEEKSEEKVGGNEEREENIVGDDNNINHVEDNYAQAFDTNTDYSQIEELKVELEQSLGDDLFKRMYKLVDSNADCKIFKCDFELIRELLIKEMNKLKYDKKAIELAIDKISEVFTIVIRERTSNINFK